MRAPRQILNIFFILLAGLHPAFAAEAAGRPVVVIIRADWCGQCQRAQPVWSRLHREYGKKVRWIVFDVTDSNARLKSAQLARAESEAIASFFARNFNRMPSVGVFDSKGALSQTLIGATAYEPYQQALEKLFPPVISL